MEKSIKNGWSDFEVVSRGVVAVFVLLCHTAQRHWIVSQAKREDEEVHERATTPSYIYRRDATDLDP
jgi:hypothetical protein